MRIFVMACVVSACDGGAVQGWQLGGFLAALAQGALGGVPLLGGGPRSYEAYYLKRQRAEAASDASEPESSPLNRGEF